MKTTYRKTGEYYLPNLKLAAESKSQNLGKYGLMRLRFLKEHKRGLYTELLLENKLTEHLKSIDDIAIKRIKQYIKEIAIQEKYANIILIGSEEEITKKAKEEKINIEGAQIIDPKKSEKYEKYVNLFYEFGWYRRLY